MHSVQFSWLQRTLTIFLSCSRLLWCYLRLLATTNLLGHTCLVETLPSSLPTPSPPWQCRGCQAVPNVWSLHSPPPTVPLTILGVHTMWCGWEFKNRDHQAGLRCQHCHYLPARFFTAFAFTSVSLPVFPNLSSRDPLVLRSRWHVRKGRHGAGLGQVHVEAVVMSVFNVS